jgi:hypothetical protein
MILLDTGYLIALFDARDALDLRAMAWSQVVEGPLWVTSRKTGTDHPTRWAG